MTGLLLSGTALLSAQPMYEMQDLMVTDCEGILTDSDNGPEEGQYDHNEDYTFTVCVDQASEIIIAFNFFSTEESYDILAIYDGPDINSPLLAMLSGSLQPPPVYIATSGCVTFHFTSDANIVANGWELHWEVMIDDPVPPQLQLLTMLMCPIDVISFQLTQPVDCSMLTAAHFTILGPGGPSIATITPLDCMNGMGQQFEVHFSSPLAQSGTYRLLFSGAILDACGHPHDVSANVVFNLTNCPFSAYIQEDDVACAGDCGTVTAVVSGEPGVMYTFQWNHTPLNQATVQICTDMAVLLSVTVTDPNTNQTVVAQYNYVPQAIPAILNPIQDTVCASMGDHFYQSDLPGGLWTSSIIPQQLQDVGRYQFWRWATMGPVNTDIVTYTAPNGCQAFDTVYVLPIDAGSIEAACLGGADFVVNGGTPAGGVWAGPHIMPDGSFSPAQVGSFVVNYTAPNGCIAYKRVNVEDGITMPDVDTLCSSQEFDLTAVPYGGRWSGPGIVNSILGRLRAWNVVPNQTYTYIYTVNGCSDTMQIYIQAIWAGPDVAMCDDESILMLTQTGTWTGPGIYLPAQNAFDVSSLGPGEYDYTLEAFGCTDVFRLTIYAPYADVKMPVTFCLEDAWIPIADHVDYNPDWGQFTGPGLAENNDEWFFNPGLAGSGTHAFIFEALGCQDTFELSVEAPAIIPEYSFCELSNAQLLMADPPGGVWSGPGFLDGMTGLFDPQLLSAGMYPITYETPLGCVTYDTIEIILRQEVSISGVSQQYCFMDTTIQISITPTDGSFFIDGVPAMPMFNPSMLGTGSHELYYTRGSGPCASSKRIFFTVLLPINGVTSPPDSICTGDNAVVEVAASGGTGTLTSTWNQGLGFGSSHIVNPAQSTTYTVTVTDGCSDPYTGTSYIYVYAPFDIDVMTGPPVCYGESSYVEVFPPSAQYAVLWLLDTMYQNNYLEGVPGIYEAEVVELFSGCKQTYTLQIPGPPPLSANFTIIPNQSCVDIIDHTVQIIDLTTGSTSGWIDFGDGTGAMPFVPGTFLDHDYLAVGDYTVTLIVTNELGCLDTLMRSVCVENKVVRYMPNVFSPNGDGQNDEFRITLFGVTDVHWEVFSRWGDKIFETDDPDAFWDGTFEGQSLDPGVFVVWLQYVDAVTGEKFQEGGSVTLVK